MERWLADYWWVLFLFPMCLVGIYVFSIPAIQAKRRGYSFLVWLVAGLLVFNPIYLLVVLGVAPHRKRQKMREQFRRELDAKLASGVPVAKSDAAPLKQTVGDQPTLLPGHAAPTSAPSQSIGEAATMLPPPRSIGDEATRL